MTPTHMQERFTVSNIARAQAEEKLLNDMNHIYEKSFDELEVVFKTEFQKSKSFKEMVLLMN